MTIITPTHYGYHNDPLRSSPRDEYLTSAYIAGRNHARDGKERRCPDEYIDDSLAAGNWEVGYDDVMSELAYERSINHHD